MTILSNIGFTGTRRGMTEAQKVKVKETLEQYMGQFHHGDCFGADEEANDIVKVMRIPTGAPRFDIFIHPPTDDSMRAYCMDLGTTILSEKGYLTRNRDIVDQTNRLIATPEKMVEEAMGGTWATIRYARRLVRPIMIFWPDGSVLSSGEWW